MIIGRPVEKIIDIVGEILAIATLILIIFLFINSKLGFIIGDTLTFWTRLRGYGIVAVLSLKALEFALKRNVIFAVICFAIIITAVVIVLIPGTVIL